MNLEPPLADPHSAQGVQHVQKPRDIKNVALAIVCFLFGGLLLFICYTVTDIAIRGILLRGFRAANQTNLFIAALVLLVLCSLGAASLWQSWRFWRHSKL